MHDIEQENERLKAALGKIDHIVANEDNLGPDDCGAIRGALQEAPDFYEERPRGDEVVEHPHLVPTITDRGFKHMPPIQGVYGGHARVYESSNAEEPRIWLSVECPIDANKPDGESQEAAVHFPLFAAELLIEQIQFLRENHYQK